jgi:hypothetical protein
MNYLGYSTDNTNIGKSFVLNPDGDLTVQGDLTVEGGVDLSGDVVVNPPNCLQTDCINTSVPASQGIVINNNYELTGQGGNVGDVLTLVSGSPNEAVFQPLTAGTARVTINKYAGNTSNIRDQTSNGVYQDIETTGFGSKSYTDDEFAEGSVINIKANGNWSYLRSSQAFIPEGRFQIIFGSVTVELFAPFPEKPFAGTYPQTVTNTGNWELIVTLTRTSPTAFRIGGVLTNSLSEAQNSVEIPISKPQQLDLLPNILSVPTFPATINVQWQDLSNQGGGNAYLYPALCQYSQDLSSSGTSVVATSENLTTDHTLLSNLTAGDAGHTQFALLAGRTLGQTLSGGVLPAESLKLKSHTAGADNVTIKDLNTQFNKNIDMDSNNIINANQITKTTPSGANLEIKHNDGPVVISGQGLLSNIQLTTPNNIIANCSLFESFAVSNEFLNGNIKFCCFQRILKWQCQHE